MKWIDVKTAGHVCDPGDKMYWVSGRITLTLLPFWSKNIFLPVTGFTIKMMQSKDIKTCFHSLCQHQRCYGRGSNWKTHSACKSENYRCCYLFNTWTCLWHFVIHDFDKWHEELVLTSVITVHPVPTHNIKGAAKYLQIWLQTYRCLVLQRMSDVIFHCGSTRWRQTSRRDSQWQSKSWVRKLQ